MRVLITGAGGSIGSRLAVELAAQGFHVIAVGHSEEPLWRLEQAFKAGGFTDYTIELADVRHFGRVKELMIQHRPYLVYHAAAVKHVPIAEQSPHEAIQTNVWGTRNITQACVECRVPRLVMVSTDKAVDPCSVMGATKRLAELYLLSRQGKTDTEMSIVRLGNVVGSSGSVLPLFQSQASQGGPLTVTHQAVERYFMTIEDAVQLITIAGNEAEGLYVLDMGEPVLINEIAESVAEEYGNKLGKKIEIEYIGLRKGEKLTEKLLNPDESIHAKVAGGKVWVVKSKIPSHTRALHHCNMLNDHAVDGEPNIVEDLFNAIMHLESEAQ